MGLLDTVLGRGGILGPGGDIAQSINRTMNSVLPDAPILRTIKQHDLPVFPLLGIAGVAAPMLVRGGVDPDVKQLPHRFLDAKQQGEQGMNYQPRMKHAAGPIRALSALSGLLGDTVQSGGKRIGQMLTPNQKPVTAALSGLVAGISKTPQGGFAVDIGGSIHVIPPGMIPNVAKGSTVAAGQALASSPPGPSLLAGLGVGAAGLAGLSALDILGSATDTPSQALGYQVEKKLYPLEDRIRATDTFAKSFLTAAGSNVAGLIDDAFRHSVQSASDTVSSVPTHVQQHMVFKRVMATDDLLSNIEQPDKEFLSRAYSTMKRFAPELAADEFATRNYLREALLASNGPDYATISNLARANQTVTDRGR